MSVLASWEEWDESNFVKIQLRKWYRSDLRQYILKLNTIPISDESELWEKVDTALEYMRDKDYWNHQLGLAIVLIDTYPYGRDVLKYIIQKQNSHIAFFSKIALLLFDFKVEFTAEELIDPINDNRLISVPDEIFYPLFERLLPFVRSYPQVQEAFLQSYVTGTWQVNHRINEVIVTLAELGLANDKTIRRLIYHIEETHTENDDFVSDRQHEWAKRAVIILREYLQVNSFDTFKIIVNRIIELESDRFAFPLVYLLLSSPADIWYKNRNLLTQILETYYSPKIVSPVIQTIVAKINQDLYRVEFNEYLLTLLDHKDVNVVVSTIGFIEGLHIPNSLLVDRLLYLAENLLLTWEDRYYSGNSAYSLFVITGKSEEKLQEFEDELLKKSRESRGIRVQLKSMQTLKSWGIQKKRLFEALKVTKDIIERDRYRYASKDGKLAKQLYREFLEDMPD